MGYTGRIGLVGLRGWRFGLGFRVSLWLGFVRGLEVYGFCFTHLFFFLVFFFFFLGGGGGGLTKMKMKGFGNYGFRVFLF